MEYLQNMVKYFALPSSPGVTQEQLLMYLMPDIVWLQKDLKISFTVNMDSGSWQPWVVLFNSYYAFTNDHQIQGLIVN